MSRITITRHTEELFGNASEPCGESDPSAVPQLAMGYRRQRRVRERLETQLSVRSREALRLPASCGEFSLLIYYEKDQLAEESLAVV